MDGRPDLIRRAAAEGIGVFALVFAGCGAIVAESEHPGTLGTVGIALVFGLIVMAMVYATGMDREEFAAILAGIARAPKR